MGMEGSRGDGGDQTLAGGGQPPPETFIGRAKTLSFTVTNSVFRSGPPKVTFDGESGRGIAPMIVPSGAQIRTSGAYGVP